jgi:hypothetical protein
VTQLRIIATDHRLNVHLFICSLLSSLKIGILSVHSCGATLSPAVVRFADGLGALELPLIRSILKLLNLCILSSA